MYLQIVSDARLDLLVAFCSMQGAEPGLDPGFGVDVSWDLPLLEGYPWVHIPNRSPRPDVGRFFGLFNPGLWRLIRDGHFDAVLVTGYFYASAWIAILAAKWSGVPIILTTDAHGLRSWRAQARWGLRLKKVLVSRIFGLAKAVLVSSTGGIAYLDSLHVARERVVLAPFVVDNEWWTRQAKAVDRSAVRAEWNVPSEAPVALFCAKLQAWKAPNDALSGFAKANVPGSFLVFTGDGPERPNLEKRAQELGILERVRFLGFVNQSRLPSVYCASDLLVLPSLFEPFGLVVNEAMLCGLPAAVSDRVGAKFDLIEPGKTGYVFAAGNVDQIAGIFREVLSDNCRRANMGAAARTRMETWSPREYVDSLVRAVNLGASK